MNLISAENAKGTDEGNCFIAAKNTCILPAYILSFSMLVTLDTNILYQALKSNAGTSYYILQRVRTKEIHMALSVPLFLEYKDVLSRDSSLKDFGLDAKDVEKFLRFIAYVSKTFKTYFLFRPNLKDEKDNMLIELAVTSQSDYLVTSNVKDFKNSELKFEKLKICTPGEFVKKWRIDNV